MIARHPMPLSRRIAVVVAAVSAVTWAAWTLWAHTRAWCPANVPLSVTQGSRTETEFRVNVSGSYDIAVEASGNSSLPLPQLVCSLGFGPLWPEKNCSGRGVLRASWIVTSQGNEVARGLSDSGTGGGTAESQSLAIR